MEGAAAAARELKTMLTAITRSRENRAVSSWTKSDAFGLGKVGQGTISRSFATSIMTRPARWTGTKV